MEIMFSILFVDSVVKSIYYCVVLCLCGIGILISHGSKIKRVYLVACVRLFRL